MTELVTSDLEAKGSGSNMRALVDTVRAAQEYKPYTPPEAGDDEAFAQARAEEIEKFNALDDALGRELDPDFPEDNDLSPPEKIWTEGKMVAKQAAERAAAKVRADGGKPRDAATGKFQKQGLGTLTASLGLDDEAPTGAGKEQPAEAPAGEDSELRRAELRLALVRSHFTEKQINEMERDGTFEKIATKRAAALKADDEAHSFVRAHSKPAEGNGKTDDQGGAPSKAPAQEQIDVDSFVKPLAAALQLDDAGASTLKQSYEKLAETVAKHAEKQIERGLASVNQAREAQTLTQLFADAQVEIGARIPDLLDPRKFEEALEVVSELGKTKVVQQQLQRYATPKERAQHLLRAAAHALELEIKPSGSESEARGERELRAHARSTISGRNRPAPSTQRERDLAAFDDSMARHGY